jgi:hypothetical protein
MEKNTKIILFDIFKGLCSANVTEIIEITNGKLLRKKYYFCG